MDNLKKILQNTLSGLVNPIMQDFGFKFYKGNNSFKRRQGDFLQNVNFYLISPRFKDDNCMGHLCVRILLESDEIQEMANKLIDTQSSFEEINMVVNFDYGLIFNNEAVTYYPKDLEDLENLFRRIIIPKMQYEVIPFLNQIDNKSVLVFDYFAGKNYIHSNYSAEVALRIIAICLLENDLKTAIEVAKKEYCKEDTPQRYKHILEKL